MSGHSKWSQIKRQKGAADVKRGLSERPFRVPLYPALPIVFLAIYAILFILYRPQLLFSLTTTSGGDMGAHHYPAKFMIAYADLEPWYDQAERLFGVRGQAGLDPTEPPRSRPYPHGAIPHDASPRHPRRKRWIGCEVAHHVTPRVEGHVSLL